MQDDIFELIDIAKKCMLPNGRVTDTGHSRIYALYIDRFSPLIISRAYVLIKQIHKVIALTQETKTYDFYT